MPLVKKPADNILAEGRWGAVRAMAKEKNVEYDDKGKIAASGKIDTLLLQQLNELEYYGKAYPKSLDNSFGIDIIYPLIKKAAISIEDALRTYTEHICIQLKKAFAGQHKKLLITGGGAFNEFLIQQLKGHLLDPGIEITITNEKLVQYNDPVADYYSKLRRCNEIVHYSD